MARSTHVLPRDVQPYLRAANGLPEIHVQAVFQVGAFFGSARRLGAAAPTAEELAEDVAKRARSGVVLSGRAARALVHVLREIESAEAHARLRSRARPASRTTGRNVIGIKSVLIVDLPLLRIAQNVVGFLNFLEALFGRFVAGIQVGMILARQPAIRLANLVFFGVARHSQRLVVIVFAGGRHGGDWCLVTSG